MRNFASLIWLVSILGCKSATQNKIYGKWVGTYTLHEPAIDQNRVEYIKDRWTGRAEIEFNDGKCSYKLWYPDDDGFFRNSVFEYSVESDTIFNSSKSAMFHIQFISDNSLRFKELTKILFNTYDLQKSRSNAMDSDEGTNH